LAAPLKPFAPRQAGHLWTVPQRRERRPPEGTFRIAREQLTAHRPWPAALQVETLLQAVRERQVLRVKTSGWAHRFAVEARFVAPAAHTLRSSRKLRSR
jgi:hypothetical protein